METMEQKERQETTLFARLKELEEQVSRRNSTYMQLFYVYFCFQLQEQSSASDSVISVLQSKLDWYFNFLLFNGR